jgi:hypothetical protein
LEFLQALRKRKIEPIFALGSKGTFDPNVVNTDWESPQELMVIGFMQRKVTYEGVDYKWDEYLLYKPRMPFYWLINNQGHWSFGQSIPAGEVNAGAKGANYAGRDFKIYDRGEPVVDYVLGEFYWEVNVGDVVKSADYIAPPDMLSRETNQNPTAPPKSADSKRDKKNREINYTVSRYVPVEEVEKAFGVTDLERPHGIAPNQPYPHKPIYRTWGLMVVAALLVLALVLGTSKRTLVNSMTKQLQPADSKVINTDPFQINGWDNVAINVHGTQWVHVSGKFIDEKGQAVAGSDFGVYTGETVYLSPLPSGKYHLQYNANWQNPSLASPSFTVQVRQDVPHFSHIFWLGLGVMGLPFCILIHHWIFDARRWSNSDYSPYSSE